MRERDLNKLRKEIRSLDAEILRLAKERIALAKRIGRWKLDHGVPVRDYEMEREVLSLTAERCRRHGLDPTVGRAITHALIAGAVKVQEDLHEKRFLGTRKRITIIGGRGKMGRWFAHYLYNRGHRVTVHDNAGRLVGFRNTSSLERGVKDAEIVIVAVPLAVGRQVYGRVIREKPPGTVVDLFSLKTPVLGEIQRALDAGLSVTSCHPLFGPDLYILSEGILLLAPCGDGSADTEAASLFEGTSLEIARVPVDQHDKSMGIVLGLSHAVNIVFTEALARSGETNAQLQRIATTTYLKQMGTAREVALENPRLYYDIQHMNEFSPAVYELFEEALGAFRKAAERGNPRAFEAIMKRGRDFFA